MRRAYSYRYNLLQLIFLAIVVLAGAGCQDQEEQRITEKSSVEQPPAGIIVAMGDSLTAGLGVAPELSYPKLLERELRETGYDYRVINAGISGETSSGALRRVEWILKMEPDIVILETGANDGLRGIAPELVRSNIARIIEIFKDKGVVVILTGMQMVSNMGTDYLERFNRIYPELASEHQVGFVPFFLEGVARQPELNQTDSIHPNEAGYRVISGNLYPYVLEAIKKAGQAAMNRSLQDRQQKSNSTGTTS